MSKESKLRNFLNKYYISIIVSVILLILFLRLYTIFIFPLRGDEPVYIYKTYLATEGWKIYKDFGDNRMPGFYLMFYPFMYIYKSMNQLPYENIIFFGRIFSYITSVISLIYIFKIGKYIRNETVGLIAVILFLISPYGIAFDSSVFLENFLTTFSLIGFYFFFHGIEKNREDTEKYLFITGIFFGLATLIKQQGILLFPMILFVLLLKDMKSFQIGRFLRNVLILFSGGFLIFIIILIYFIYQGTLNDFLYSIITSVEQSYTWASPTEDKIVSIQIIPMLQANELFTLIFGFFGITFSLITFFKDDDFELKTLSLWFVCYVTMVYMISNSYMFYYIPMLPILTIISAYMIYDFIDFINNGHKNIFIVLIIIILGINIYNISGKYQNFVYEPVERVNVIRPSLDEQILIAKYLYKHTKNDDRIFSIDSTYASISGRYGVNHFFPKDRKGSSMDEELIAKELIFKLNDNRIKYVIIDDIARLRFKNKWDGVLEYILQNFQEEKEFIITRKIDGETTTVSLYKRKERDVVNDFKNKKDIIKKKTEKI